MFSYEIGLPGPKQIVNYVIALAPGVLLAVVISVLADRISSLEAQWALAVFHKQVSIAPPVIALVVGIGAHLFGARAEFAPGLSFSIKRVLRWSIALSGLNVAFSDITELGVPVLVMVMSTMAVTLAAGFVFARILKLGDELGALAGAACAVCGASAALATASVLPGSRSREGNTAYIVIIANMLATMAMLTYPPFCAFMGFDDRTTGVFLGASIHDVAQVVGAGYSVSAEAGNVALIVKLFRVFLLLPVVIGIGWRFAQTKHVSNRARVPIPIFAFMFLVFVGLNSLGVIAPDLKTWLALASRWGLLMALAALGLNTSFDTLRRVGLRPFLLVLMTTAVVFLVPAIWLRLSV